MPQTTLQKNVVEYETKSETRESVQLRTTVPGELAEALGWDAGDTIEWTVASGSKIAAEKIEE